MSTKHTTDAMTPCPRCHEGEVYFYVSASSPALVPGYCCGCSLNLAWVNPKTLKTVLDVARA